MPLTNRSLQPEAPVHAPSAAGVRPVSIVWRQRHLLLAAFDLSIVVGTFLFSYILRFDYRFLALKEVGPPAIELYAKGAVILAAVWVFRLWRRGSYERGLRTSIVPMQVTRDIAISGFNALCTLMVVSFLYRELLLSRQVYLMTAVMSAAGMLGIRAVFERADRALAGRGYARMLVAIVGTTRTAEDFARAIQEPDGLVRVVGHFSTGLEPQLVAQQSGIRLLGDVADIADVYARVPFDRLVLASPALTARALAASDRWVIDLLNFCEQSGVALNMLPGSFDVTVSPAEVTSVAGTPVIHLRDASLHPLYAVTKRVLDVTIAGAVLLLGLPVWLAIAAAIKLTSRGPVIFAQDRAGHHGVPFRMFKFRSMDVDAEARLKDFVVFDRLAEPVFKLRDDPRVTPIGRFLRRTGLDEVPQLLNVLQGRMSIVGPRPEEMALVARYDSVHRRRLKARPGITGYQQIVNRGEPSLVARVRHDLLYLKHQSLLLDCYIMLKTVGVVIRGGGITH